MFGAKRVGTVECKEAKQGPNAQQSGEIFGILQEKETGKTNLANSPEAEAEPEIDFASQFPPSNTHIDSSSTANNTADIADNTIINKKNNNCLTAKLGIPVQLGHSPTAEAEVAGMRPTASNDAA